MKERERGNNNQDVDTPHDSKQKVMKEIPLIVERRITAIEVEKLIIGKRF